MHSFLCGFFRSVALFSDSSLLLGVANHGSLKLPSDLTLCEWTGLLSFHLLMNIWVISSFGYHHKSSMDTHI